ncbi:DNA ligase (ATP) DNL4 [Sporobolomyces koalae]|uniref:DNA ligase (ATP) DNL4 n=1 Tax=Sporobolomyces koalae TaxID=500713 RepID=UPI00317FB985
MPQNYSNYRARLKEEQDEEGPLAEPDDIERPPGLVNKADAPFGSLCGLLEVLETANREGHKKPGYKGTLIAKFFERWRDRVGNDFYPLIRLLLPERDTRRRTYNLKEQKLAKAIVTALDIPPESADARKLINWKIPTKEDEAAGEFATVAEKVITSRSSVITKYGSLSIDGVNNILDQISRTVPTVGADGKKRMPSQQHARLIKECIGALTPKEMKWFIRIILRDLKAGFREKTILNQFHEDAVDVFNTCSDIKRVCWQLWNPKIHVSRDTSTIVPFRSFVPMFCFRLKGGLSDIVRHMKKGRPNTVDDAPVQPGAYTNDEFILEEKLDGERIQLHKVGDSYRYFSRKAKDYTHLYGADSRAGSLTPYIGDLISRDVQDVILDGEMLVWDPNLVKYMPFGNLKSFASAGNDPIGPSDPRPCFKVFDVLYARGKNGNVESCLNKPLWIRKQLLANIVTPKKGVLELADCVRATSVNDIKTYLERIVAERGEGLVIKHPLSKYLLGARDAAWIKVKPEYMDALGETIDAVVIGGYWGEGRRGGLLSSFLVGLRDEQSDGTTRWLSFAKVGSGLNRDDYIEIGKKVGSKLMDRKKGTPEWYVSRGEVPDVFINPADSFVLEIKAAEIVGGADYGADMTLRFPRAMRIRLDKDHTTSDDIDTVKEMRQTTKKRDHVGETFTQKKKARAGVRSAKASAVAPHLADVQVATDIFAGITVFVNEKGKAEMKEVTTKVREHGAKLIQTIPATSLPDRLVISQELDNLLKRKKGINEIDIVRPAWVSESIAQKRRLPLHKRFMIQATPATESMPDYDEIDTKDALDVEPPAMHVGSYHVDKDSDEEEIAPLPSATWQPRARTPAHDSDDDGELEPDTEGSDLEPDFIGEKESGTEEDMEEDAHERDEARSEIVNLMNRSRLVTRSPTLETDFWVGPFSPYTAYFDTSSNAIVNKIDGARNVAGIEKADQDLRAASSQFVRLGGNVTDDLSNPSLTHIIMAPDALESRLELHNRTKEPKLRRIVTTAWIHDSAAAGSVIDEGRYIA